jgi:hypothetical protein
MNPNSGQIIQSINQSSLADDIVAAMVAVVSNVSAPDSALGGLKKTWEDSLRPEQRAAAAALQAYGVECGTEVLAAGLETDAKERITHLGQALQKDSEDDTLALLRSDPEAGEEFKSRLSLAIATKCADLIAAEIDREKKGHFTILNKDDAAVFEKQREEHRKQRADAARTFLASLPGRYPSFGPSLFAMIRRDVQQNVAEQHKRPDTNDAVTALFDSALASMPEAEREAVSRAAAQSAN